MANVKNNAAAQETRRKLIEVAGEIFAQHGLHGTTAKQITDRAGVNVSAVNYHFKDKIDLYMEVLRSVFADSQVLAEPLTGPAEVRLRQFILRLVLHASDPRKPAWHTTLFSRELSEPTTALNWMADSVAGPPTRQLVETIRDLAAPSASDSEVAFLAFAAIAQCIFFTRDRALLERMFPKLDVLRDSKKLADRIADFVLAAIKGHHPTEQAKARSKR